MSKVSALANAQLGIVRTETEWEVAVGCSVVAVHLGTSLETLAGVEGASANMATSVVLVVWQSEWKTGPCAAFDVKVAGQETNTTRGVIKFRSRHRSASPFRGRHGHGNGKGGGDEWIGGSSGLEGSLLTGANLRMKGQKFLLYLLDPLLRRQLKGRYWWGGWCANQEGGGWSRWLTLINKCSHKLFHGVNEDREFGGFGFRGGSKGRSERKRTIVCEHRSGSAMKDKVCSVVDLF